MTKREYDAFFKDNIHRHWTKSGIERLAKAIGTPQTQTQEEAAPVDRLLKKAEDCMHYAATIIQTARDDDTDKDTVIEIAQELEAWAIAYLTAAMSIMLGRDLPETTEDINSMLYIYRGLYNED